MSVSQTVIDGMRSEIAALRAAVAAKKYGALAGGVWLVMGDQDIESLKATRLAAMPEAMRAAVKPKVVHLPWLSGRAVQGHP